MEVKNNTTLCFDKWLTFLPRDLNIRWIGRSEDNHKRFARYFSASRAMSESGPIKIYIPPTLPKTVSSNQGARKNVQQHKEWRDKSRPATIHRCIAIFFCHDTNIVYWTSYCDICNTFTYVSTNMGKHCLQIVLTLLPLFSPCTQRFSEQTDKKNPRWAVFSVIFKMADTTNACVLPTRLVTCTDFWAHEQDTNQYPSCFVM